MTGIIIDATWDRLCLILVAGDKIYKYIGESGARRHSPSILAEADKLFTAGGVTPRDIEVVGAVVGPGSFTGIRIGVATANAMAKAVGAKVVELTELEALIEGRSEAIALIDCKHDNYYALRRFGGKDEYFAANIAEIELFPEEKVFFSEELSESLVSVFTRKISAGEFKDKAQPFYIKKSSAEA